MNIFYLDPNPKKAAAIMCDQHVIKMILESAQMLSTAHHLCGSTATYKKTHENHPSAIWARSTHANYEWLHLHMVALGQEYTRRFGKIHKTIREQSILLAVVPPGVPRGALTEMPQCMPVEYQGLDPIVAYTAYYAGKAADWQALGRPMRYRILAEN